MISGSTINEHLKSLEYKIDAEGLHPLPEKIEAIVEAPSPTNVTQFMSYLGLLSYYSRFLPNLTFTYLPCTGY